MTPYIGQIIMFCGNFAPKGWAFCDGRTLPIAQYTALFSVIGAKHGGDGKTTFALPNLIERTPIHPGGTKPFGSAGGAATKKLTTAQIPPHTHTVTAKIKAKATAGNKNSPVGNYPANTSFADREYNTTANGAMAADTISATVSTDGGDTGFTNMQQYQVVNFIIALTGVFPPRS